MEQFTGFTKLKILKINADKEWLESIDEEIEDYIFVMKGVRCCKINIFLQDNLENIFKYSFIIKETEQGSKSGAIKYINQCGDSQWVTSKDQLWDNFKQWEKILSWQKNGQPVPRWESGAVPLEKEVIKEKVYRTCLQGEENLVNFYKALYPTDKNDTSLDLLFDIDKLFKGDFSELTIPEKPFCLVGFLYVSDKGEQKVHKIFFPLDFMKDVNNGMTISNYYKNTYKEFINSLEFTEGNWELGKCQLFKPEFIKLKNLTEDKDDY